MPNSVRWAMDTVIDPGHFVCNRCRCLHKRELLTIPTFSLERQALINVFMGFERLILERCQRLDEAATSGFLGVGACVTAK